MFILRVKPRGCWSGLGPCTARPSRWTPGPGISSLHCLAAAGGAHSRRQAQGHPKQAEVASTQLAAPGCSRERRPRARTLRARRPGRSAAGYLRAVGGGWRLRALFARGWLPQSGRGPSAHSLRGPGSDRTRRTRKRVDSAAFRSSDATSDARGPGTELQRPCR